MYSLQQIKLSILFNEIYKASYFWRRVFYHFSCENYKTFFFCPETFQVCFPGNGKGKKMKKKSSLRPAGTFEILEFCLALSLGST